MLTTRRGGRKSKRETGGEMREKGETNGRKERKIEEATPDGDSRVVIVISRCIIIRVLIN